MNLNKVDLNLFVVFDAIYTEANLTRAGQIIGITQPAVSNALARLRESFNDPLFVRTAQGMVPTPMAQNIINPVRSALALLRVSVQESRTFNPLQANKTFRISMTDLTEAVVLPPLFQRLRKQAPSVVVESLLSHRRETTSDLAAGRLDFAIDAPLNTDPQVRHVKLMEDRYVCAMRPAHPLAGQPSISLDEYLGLTHIHISTRRNGLGQVDLALGKMGLQRKITLRSQHYLMASNVLQHTDMVMTVPERFARRHALHFVALPLNELPNVETHLYWHESTEQDPANRWMRELLIELCEQQVALETRQRAQPLLDVNVNQPLA
ncbi:MULTISPECIES: LysR family transcriptional regulator [Pseudomonas]|jgi:DNA-binding transcriptional LysR family regulator|uniref:LysR family transcriptional regulator n=1 Tax=Pseudomonas lundensis TaxID=86185 RepID=A0AAX2H417_9PSED|nr:MULTISPECIES: LysR family transcriptional regulator [Pseudomonas]KMM90619.1 LysR family transcriptional regulator [Pseudomonas lundensis]MBM1183557.1 LysR family transcriptional regulator [Pseudomonas lundensis]MCT8951691.1 LysR family transcriptional regulator [Pseudomonas lundensis]NMZ56267.1 LysR family transcriptional regulator [Pseudomonas lundensis]NNA17654.1 LysR family transcriptional regulator [Pseudomonas lundensis]